MAAERAKRQEAEKRQTESEQALAKQTDANQALKQKVTKLQGLIKEKEGLIKEKDRDLAKQDPPEKTARLQLRLLEKEAQQRELAAQLEEAIQEVVRTKAKLRSMESKAEAAAHLAEAEIALQALKTKVVGRKKDPGFVQAEQLMQMSAVELKKENYSGALYLAGQAKNLIKEGEERSQGLAKMPLVADEIPFALPLSLRVLSASNIREGPGLEFKVLSIAETDTALTGYSYKDQWVRVKGEDGREGWIIYNRVDGR